MTPRAKRTVAAIATAVVLTAVLAAAYFGYYAVVVLPDIRRAAADVILSVTDSPPIDCPFVPKPTRKADAGALYEQAAGLDRARERFAVDDLVDFARHTRPARPDVDVDSATLKLVRRAAKCRTVSLPGDPLCGARKRAGLPTAHAAAAPVPDLSRLGMALVGAAEVHMAAGRRDQADTDFRLAYNVGRHLDEGAVDVEALRLSLTVRRMACAGFKQLATTAPQPDAALIREIDKHLYLLANLSRGIESKWLLIQGSHPDQVEAAARVARDDKDPVWRREAVIGLIRLSRLRASSAAHAWLIRRRARRALAELTDDPDTIVAALASEALK